MIVATLFLDNIPTSKNILYGIMSMVIFSNNELMRMLMFISSVLLFCRLNKVNQCLDVIHRHITTGINNIHIFIV
jgi:hypothetical protein